MRDLLVNGFSLISFCVGHSFFLFLGSSIPVCLSEEIQILFSVVLVVLMFHCLFSASSESDFAALCCWLRWSGSLLEVWFRSCCVRWWWWIQSQVLVPASSYGLLCSALRRGEPVYVWFFLFVFFLNYSLILSIIVKKRNVKMSCLVVRLSILSLTSSLPSGPSSFSIRNWFARYGLANRFFFLLEHFFHNFFFYK